MLSLERKQYKNDSTKPKNWLVLKLPVFSLACSGEWKSAAISKLTNFFGSVESLLYYLSSRGTPL